MKRVIVGIAFGAMLALTFVAGGSDAYARTKLTPPAPVTNPAPNPGLIQAFGVSWE